MGTKYARGEKKKKKKKEKIFWWGEGGVADFKRYVASLKFRDHIERATGDDGRFTQPLLTASGCMLSRLEMSRLETVKVRNDARVV